MSYISERRQEEKDRRRGQILDAAEDLYRELGWDAVTMDSVARNARLSRALVYVYFRDKRDLHLGIALRALELLRARFDEARARARTGLDQVEAIGRAYMAYGQEFPHYFDAFARLEMQSAESAPGATQAGPQEQASMQAVAAVHQCVVDALEAGQRDGTISADIGEPCITSRVLWGFTHGVIQIAITKSGQLAQFGIGVPQFGQHAITLLRQMLAGPKA